MKTILNKLAFPFFILLVVNVIGILFHKNYEGAVVGSVVGMIIGLLALEIRAKFE